MENYFSIQTKVFLLHLPMSIFLLLASQHLAKHLLPIINAKGQKEREKTRKEGGLDKRVERVCKMFYFI